MSNSEVAAQQMLPITIIFGLGDLIPTVSSAGYSGFLDEKYEFATLFAR
jgi:hypothetical protein